MILVLDAEVVPDYRYLAPEIAFHLPDADYHVIAAEPEHPPIADYDGVVISGSTHSVYDEAGRGDWFDAVLSVVDRCVTGDVPLLGVCYGHQVINHALGGRVEQVGRRATFVEMTEYDQDASGVLEGVEPVVPVLHQDVVAELGEGMTAVARTDYDEHFCSRHGTAPVWTVQFHPEFTERVVEESSDFDPGEYGFEDCNATRVFDNFAGHVAAGRTDAGRS